MTTTSSTTGPASAAKAATAGKTSSKTKKASTKQSAATEERQDLRERTREFAQNTRGFLRRTPRTIVSMGDCRQLLRASGSIGASYIDASDAPGREIFLRCMSDCRRHARLTTHWLELMGGDLEERSEQSRQDLLTEAHELERIFGAIVGKVLTKMRAEREAAHAEVSAS